MKKVILVLIITLSFSYIVHAQTANIAADSTVNTLKTYLLKHIRYPAVERENNVQGKMAVIIHLNNSKMIDSVSFARHLDTECDAEVVKKLEAYKKPILLPGYSYTIGLQFQILEQHDDNVKTIPFDTSKYKNFLLEVDIVAFAMKRRIDTVY